MSSIKQAGRQLVLRPGLSALVILMLALGIGSTTAMFSVIYQALMQPLSVPNAGRLVDLTVPGPKFSLAEPQGLAVAVTVPSAVFSYPMFRDLEKGQTSFTGLAAYYNFLVDLGHGRQVTPGRGVLVSGRYFDLVNLRPVLGRLIGPEDTSSIGEGRVAVLSYAYWQNRLGSDPSVIGKPLTVNGQTLTIIGVTPPGFRGMMKDWRTQVFVPITMRWLMQPEAVRNDHDRRSYWLHLFARLKPGVGMTAAAHSINQVYAPILANVEAPRLTQLGAAQRKRFTERRIVLKPGARGQSGATDTRGPEELLIGATVLVLLIVCINVANVLIARGVARAGEMAIRTSMGASRGRLIRQLLTEAGLLALLGGAFSVPTAMLTMRSVHALLPDSLGYAFTSDFSVTTLLIAAFGTLATVLLFGLVPALRTSQIDPARAMKGQGAQAAGGRGAARMRDGLVRVQIAFSVILLVLAGLFMRSVVNVSRVDLGMNVNSLVGFGISPLLNGYRGEKLDALYGRIANRLKAQPGVVSVASTAVPLMGNAPVIAYVSVPGAKSQPGSAFGGAPLVQINPLVSPGLFKTLQIPLLAGRDFSATDKLDQPAVAVVNQAFVHKFALGTNPVGKQLRLQGLAFVPHGPLEIVGVVGDTRYSCVKNCLLPQIYTPPPRAEKTFGSLFFYVRTRLDPNALVRSIPNIIARIDPNLPVRNLTTVQRQTWENYWSDRFLAALIGGFAALATLLAAIGLYGVLSYNVELRTREMGLRLALGAEPKRLRTMVIKQVGVRALIGGAIGLLVAIGLGRLAGALFFGLSGFDPLVIGAATAVIALVVLVASYLPARRAAKVAPMDALRYE